jgi:hypothetical protein
LSKDTERMHSVEVEMRSELDTDELDTARHYARCIIASRCLTYRLKTLSGLRSGKRYDKNAIASGPRRGINPLYLLN